MSSGSLFSSSMASRVGRTSSSILRRFASRFTSSITGRLPYAPVPTTTSDDIWYATMDEFLREKLNHRHWFALLGFYALPVAPQKEV